MPDDFWEPVHGQRQGRDVTERTKVPGGWIYRSVIWGSGETLAVAMVFIPEKEETRTYANDPGRNRS